MEIFIEKEEKMQDMFTQSLPKGMVSYEEREVSRFNFEGFEVVGQDMFSNQNRPAVRFKNGLVVFNAFAIRKFGGCSHIQMLMHPEKKTIIAKPSGKDEKDSVQWSKVDKNGKVAPRAITNQSFTAQIYRGMKWNSEDTVKMSGTLQKIGEEKMLVFSLS